MRITVQVSTELVRKGLENLFGEVPQVSRQRIRTVMERAKRRMQEYPPERPGQSKTSSHPVLGTTYQAVRYRRTGNLGSHWAIGETEKGSGYTLENTAKRRGKAYGRYVVGRADGTGQAWMHVGRWQLLRDVIDDEVAKLPEQVLKDIKLVARKEGFSA